MKICVSSSAQSFFFRLRSVYTSGQREVSWAAVFLPWSITGVVFRKPLTTALFPVCDFLSLHFFFWESFIGEGRNLFTRIYRSFSYRSASAFRWTDIIRHGYFVCVQSMWRYRTLYRHEEQPFLSYFQRCIWAPKGHVRIERYYTCLAWLDDAVCRRFSAHVKESQVAEIIRSPTLRHVQQIAVK